MLRYISLLHEYPENWRHKKCPATKTTTEIRSNPQKNTFGSASIHAAHARGEKNAHHADALSEDWKQLDQTSAPHRSHRSGHMHHGVSAAVAYHSSPHMQVTVLKWRALSMQRNKNLTYLPSPVSHHCNNHTDYSIHEDAHSKRILSLNTNRLALSILNQRATQGPPLCKSTMIAGLRCDWLQPRTIQPIGAALSFHTSYLSLHCSTQHYVVWFYLAHGTIHK